MATAEQYRQASTQMDRLAELKDEEEEAMEEVQQELDIELKGLFSYGEVLSELDEIAKVKFSYGNSKLSLEVEEKLDGED